MYPDMIELYSSTVYNAIRGALLSRAPQFGKYNTSHNEEVALMKKSSIY